MKSFTVGLLLALSLVVIFLGCSKESAVHGKWSRDEDAIILELLKDKTGVITANNVKIYKKRGMAFPSDVQLEQKMRCKWSLSANNELLIEEVDTPTPSKLTLKLAGDTLSKDGKVIYVRKKG